MDLDAANLKIMTERAPTHEIIRDIMRSEENFPRWVEHSCSTILHHDRECCEEARLWFLSYARAMEVESMSQYQIRSPTWLSQLFTWGRSQWPISWCELVREKVLDCGVFAALSREIFSAQGHKVHPAQALISYNKTSTDHWKDLWNEEETRRDGTKIKGEAFPWIGNEIVYHELCLLEMPDMTARVYDSTWGIWHQPLQRVGYGSLLAIRTECPRLVFWGHKLLSCGEWVEL